MIELGMAILIAFFLLMALLGWIDRRRQWLRDEWRGFPITLKR